MLNVSGKLRSKSLSLACDYCSVGLLTATDAFIPFRVMLLRLLKRRQLDKAAKYLAHHVARQDDEARFLADAVSRRDALTDQETVALAGELHRIIRCNRHSAADGQQVIQALFEYSWTVGYLGCLRLAAALRAVGLLELLERNDTLSHRERALAMMELLAHPASLLPATALAYAEPSNSEKANLNLWREAFVQGSTGKESDLQPDDIDDRRTVSFSGRHAYVAGPSERETDLTPEAEDLIVSLSYAGNQSLPTTHRGLKVEASFYPPHKLKRMAEDGSISHIGELRYVFLKQNVKQVALVERQTHPENVYISPVNYQAIYTDLNAGIETVVLLKLLGCTEVKLTNLDLFVNAAYPSGYKSNRDEGALARNDTSWRMASSETLRSLGLNHNPAFQFSIYRYLHERGEVTCDNRLASLLNGGVYDYLKRLELQYGTLPLAQ